MSKPRIAFLGLGIMGGGMARRLLSHEFPLTVFNRSPEKSKVFAARGATRRDRLGDGGQQRGSYRHHGRG